MNQNPPKNNNFRFISKQLLSFVAIAGFSTVTFPLQMIRTRMQTTVDLMRHGAIAEPYKGVGDCVRTITRLEGYRGFWKGNFANVLRVIPNQSFNYFAKESIQIWAKRCGLAKEGSISLNFISSMIGGVSTLLFIYPLDFVRSRLSNDVTGKKSMWRIFNSTYRKQGLRGIYRGSVNFFVSSAIFRGLYFGIYDSIKKLKPDNYYYKISGCYVGSMIAIYSVYPFDTIRKRMIMTSGQNFKYGSFFNCARTITRQEGLGSFYRGWQLSLGQGIGVAGSLVVLDAIATDIKRKSGIE